MDESNNIVINEMDMESDSATVAVPAVPNRKIRYSYVISTIFVTRKRYSRVFDLDGEAGWFQRFSVGLPYTFITLLLGWWGFPFGLIYTPLVILKNTLGGEDVTFKPEKLSEKEVKYTNNKLQEDK